jgi:hypothetical protein
MSCMHLPSFTIYICIFNIFHILWLSFATRYPIIHPAPCNADQYPQCLRDTSLVLCCSSSLPFRRENRGKSREVEIDVSCFQPNPSRYIYILQYWFLPVGIYLRHPLFISELTAESWTILAGYFTPVVVRQICWVSTFLAALTTEMTGLFK